MRTILFFIFLFILGGCSNLSNDEEAPVIEEFEVNQSAIEAGGSLEVQLRVSDNEELTQLRLRIQEAFSKSFEAWNDQRIEIISGTNFIRNYSFELPDSALSGLYEVSLQVSDERGNVSNDSLQSFRVFLKDFAPRITNFETKPPLLSDGTISLFDGDTLVFKGIAQDDTLLNRVEIELLSVSGLQLEKFVYDLIPDSVNTWSFVDNSDSVFTSQLQSSPSSLILRVIDEQGHLLREEIPILFFD